MPRPNIRALARRVAPLALVCVLGGYLLAFHDVDLNLADEGFFLTHALSIEKGPVDGESIGRLLRRQIGLMYHGWFQLTGHADLKNARLMWLTLRLALALMVLAVARRMMPWPWAAACAALAVVAAGPWHKTWYPFALGTLLYLTGRSLEGRRGHTVAVGLAGGALVTLHYVGIGGFVLLPVCGFLVLEPVLARRATFRVALRTAGILVASALAGLVLICTVDAVIVVATRGADPWLVARGPLSALERLSPAHLGTILRYSSSWAGQGRLPLAALFAEPGVLGKVPGLVFLLQPVVLLLALWLLRTRSAGRPLQERRIAWLVLVLAAAGVVKTWARADLFHVMHAAAPSYLLMAYLLWRGSRALRGRWTTARATARAAAATGLALAALVFPLGLAASVLSSPSQWAGSIGSLALAQRPLRLERARIRLPSGRADQLQAVIRRIQTWSSPDEPIFAMPFCPGLYFLSDRLCVADDDHFPMGLLAVVPGLGLTRPRADEHLAHLLRSRRTPLVVQCPAPERVSGGSIPLTRALLEKRYAPAYRREGFVILRRR